MKLCLRNSSEDVDSCPSTNLQVIVLRGFDRTELVLLLVTPVYTLPCRNCILSLFAVKARGRQPTTRVAHVVRQAISNGMQPQRHHKVPTNNYYNAKKIFNSFKIAHTLDSLLVSISKDTNE